MPGVSLVLYLKEFIFIIFLRRSFNLYSEYPALQLSHKFCICELVNSHHSFTHGLGWLLDTLLSLPDLHPTLVWAPPRSNNYILRKDCQIVKKFGDTWGNLNIV